MSIVKYDPEAEKRPSVLKNRRYPVTVVISIILGLPVLLFCIAVILGGADVSTKFLLVGIVLFFYLLILGISFILEGEGKHSW